MLSAIGTLSLDLLMASRSVNKQTNIRLNQNNWFYFRLMEFYKHWFQSYLCQIRTATKQIFLELINRILWCNKKITIRVHFQIYDQIEIFELFNSHQLKNLDFGSKMIENQLAILYLAIANSYFAWKIHV